SHLSQSTIVIISKRSREVIDSFSPSMRVTLCILPLVFIPIGLADIWGEAWKKLRENVKDESVKVIKKAGKELNRWKDRLEEINDEKEPDTAPTQPLPPTIPPAAIPSLPPPFPPPPYTEAPPPSPSTVPPLPAPPSPSPLPLSITSSPQSAAEPLPTQSSSVPSSVGIISLIFVGLGAFLSLMLLAVRWYRRRHPSIPPYPPPLPPRDRRYDRMDEDRSLTESGYSTINLEPMIMAESPT
ncbi:hypothetical protein PMAYCL1PPCAC_29074, partial [Pristionchus mayeri]